MWRSFVLRETWKSKQLERSKWRAFHSSVFWCVILGTFTELWPQHGENRKGCWLGSIFRCIPYKCWPVVTCWLVVEEVLQALVLLMDLWVFECGAYWLWHENLSHCLQCLILQTEICGSAHSNVQTITFAITQKCRMLGSMAGSLLEWGEELIHIQPETLMLRLQLGLYDSRANWKPNLKASSWYVHTYPNNHNLRYCNKDVVRLFFCVYVCWREWLGRI
jgi:hypothetical protein